ncbi:MAG TPA: DinB family protein [Ferruginibacter sp.]|nr:DinB family protein [Ferruginibacter sp.]
MQTIIDKLQQIITDYSPQLTRLDEENFTHKPSPVKWSGKEYLGHLIDSAQNNIRRFVVAQHQDKPFIVYEQEKWVQAANYQNYPLKDLIGLWILINKHMVIILKNIPDEDLDREVQTQDIHSIEWLAADYNKHLLHHLHQVLHLEPVAYP